MGASAIAATTEGELVSRGRGRGRGRGGTQEGKKPCYLAAIKLQPFPKASPEEAQNVKITGYWPQIAEVHIKGMTSVSPDSRIFHIC